MTNFMAESVEKHYGTMKARYIKIKKMNQLSDVGWDDATKTITLNPIVPFTYAEVR